MFVSGWDPRSAGQDTRYGQSSRARIIISTLFLLGGCAPASPDRTPHEIATPREPVQHPLVDATVAGDAGRDASATQIAQERAAANAAAAIAARTPSRVVRRGQWSSEDRLLSGEVLDGARSIAAVPERWQVSGPDRARDERAGVFTVRVDEDPAQWSRAWLVYELSGSSHWSAIRRKINQGIEQGGFRPSRVGAAGTQVEEIAPAWLVRGSNTVRFEPRDTVDPTGFTVASVRIVAQRSPSASPEPLSAPLEFHGGAFGRWTDGEPTTAVTGAERNPSEREGTWSWREPARVSALSVLTRGTGNARIELSWTAADGRTRVRRALDIAANRTAGEPEQIAIAPAIEASDLRIAMLSRSENVEFAIAEIDVVAERVSTGAARRLALTWPAHGECVEREAYVRGFALGADGRAAAELWLDGQQAMAQTNADGSFGLLFQAGERAPGEHWIEARFADGSSERQRFVLGQCGAHEPPRTDAPRPDVGAPFSGWARATSATTLTLGDAVLEIPAGAVAQDTQITLRPIASSQVAALDRGMINVSPDGRAYRFGPDGLRFSKPIRLSLPFARSRLSPGSTEADAKAFFYDVGARRWREVPRVASGADDRVAAATNHFTDYITATITAPDSPQSTAFDANTIQGLQAANPAAGVQMISPPSPNSMGSANLSFPIVVPPGRHGMQPSIALNYDSSRGNGWLGVGWDISVSRVEVDTRNGVPEYTATSEESYLLDGAQLVAVDPATSNPRRYARRIEGAFDLIYRHGTTKSDYWWDVRTRDGTRMIYGRRSGPPVGSPYPDHGRLSEAPGSPIGRWMLEETRDEFNNAVLYHYEVRRTAIDPTANIVEQYLREIEYTVSFPDFDSVIPSLASRYFVRFETDFVRSDMQSSGRLGFLVKTSGRLAAVQVDGIGAEPRIRRYSLVYTSGEFGKSLLQSVMVAGVAGSTDLYSHSFEYEHAPTFSGRIGFSAPELFAHTPTAMRSGFSAGVGGNVHVGMGDVFHSINIGGGGGGGYTTVANESERVDANGDGLPDLLGSHLVRQTRDAAPEGRFAETPVLTGHLRVGDSESRSGQLNIGLHVFDMGAGGVDGAWSWNNTHRVLADANGDGFVDLVTGPHRVTIAGVSADVLNVYENPTPHSRTTFGLNTVGGPTADYTIGGVVVQPPSVEVTDPALIAAINNNNALTAPLVAWHVIRRGSIRITGAIEHPASVGDGVRVEIYRVSGMLGSTAVQTPIWAHTILPTDPPCTPGPSHTCGTGLDLSDLLRDDRIYFMVRPGATAASTAEADRVNWSPRITYTSVDPVDQCTSQDLGCPWPESSEPVTVGTYFDRSEDFRTADRDVSGWTSIRRGKLSIESANIVLPAGISADARIWVRRAIRTSTGLPVEIGSLPLPDGGSADASTDAAPAPALTPAAIDSELSSYSNTLIPVTPLMSIPAGGGAGPSIAGFDTYTGDQFYLSIKLPNDKVDPALVRWEPLIHYTEWCGPDSTGTTVCQPITDCNTPAGAGIDGSPGCRWQNPIALGPDAAQWIPLSVVQQPRPLTAVSIFDEPSRMVGFFWFGPWPMTVRRVDQTMGWFRRWSAGEWRADVEGLIERNLIDPMWTATAPPSDTPGAIAGEPIASRRTPVFVGMAAQRLPLDNSDQSSATRNQYGVPAGWVIAPGSVEETQWVGSGRISAINRWSLIPSRRGGYRIETSGPTSRIVPDGDWTASAFEGASLRASDGPTGGFNITLMGVGAGYNAGLSTTTLDFFDINGDRLPDSIQEHGVVRLQQRRAPGASHTTLSADRVMSGMFPQVRRSIDSGVRSGFSIGSAAGGVRKAMKRAGSLTGGMNTALGYLGYMPSFGRTEGRSADVIDWLDINGDGLLDHVRADGDEVSVAYNLGTRFAPPVPLAFDGGVGKDDPEELAFDALSVTTSLSTNVEFGYLGSGGGASWNFTYGQSRFIDMNGDGLPDRVWARNPSVRDGRLRVRFNLGSSFSSAVDWNAPSWNSTGYAIPAEDDALTYAWGSGVKATAGVIIEIPVLPFWDFSIVGSIGGNLGYQQQAGRISLEDINGDGLIDHVFAPTTAGGISPSTNRIYARINRTGRANLLRRVLSPFGARMDLDYALVGNRVETLANGERIDMPSARYVLSAVRTPGTTQETPEGPNTEYVTNISYGGGFYDRNEREDYGFSSVTVCNIQQTCTVTNYNNQSYLLHGSVSSSYVRDSLGRRTAGSETTYEFATAGLPIGVTQVRPKLSRKFIYDGVTVNPTPSITTEVERFYDSAGRLQSIVDRGEPGNADNVTANITEYFTSVAPYNIVRPRVIEVRDDSGSLLRRREATFGTVGQLLSTTDRLDGGIDPEAPTPTPYVNRAVTTTFAYDTYGNVVSVTDPVGLALTYAYNNTTAFTHRMSITDNFGLSSSMDYDMRFGAVKQTTDTNGHEVHVKFDDYGRTTEVWGPYDNPATSTPTISYEYQLAPGAIVTPRAWAITHHKDGTRATTIDTVTFIDRTLRVVQTKKSGELDSGSGVTATKGWVVSGPIEYDDIGRPWRQWRGGFDTNPSSNYFVPIARTTADPYTETSYDTFGRGRVVRAPDGTQIHSDFSVEAVPGESTLRLHTQLTDALGHQRHSYARADGSVVEVRESNVVSGATATLRTRYSYDVLGRLQQVLDANGNATTATYDSLGRMISLNNGDSGLIEYQYDVGGDLSAKITPNLRAMVPAQRIRYTHDRHRLTNVYYPDGRAVHLYYGGAGSWGNGAGRLQMRVDDSGTSWFAYGKLGETTTTWRWLGPAGSLTSSTLVTTLFDSDSFGRQRSVTYNDGEVVNYDYDLGGNLRSVQGLLPGGGTRDYLSFVGYDEFGQRSRVLLGNGTETRYQRDPLMQRLEHVDTDGPGKVAIQRLFYRYNDAGNITERSQLLDAVMGGSFGGEVSQSFEYDDLGQLTKASGYYRESSTHERRYELAMDYDAIGNITENTQTDVRSLLGGASPTTVTGTTHSLGYAYQQFGSTRPHAATTVGTRTFSFDANGNQLGWVDSSTGSSRTVVWDEDDRIESITTDGTDVSFRYDAAGERTHKWTKTVTSVYANAYWSERNGSQVTKHIFASGQRIASVVTDPWTGPQAHWFHTDHLGSTQFVTDGSGAVREHHESLPFGEPWIEESSDSDTTLFRFTGKEFDSETGLQYFGARYYDPRQAQWVSVDPALVEFHGRSSRWRRDVTMGQAYTYSANSPLRLVDHDGRAWHCLVGAAVGATISAASYVLTCVATNAPVTVRGVVGSAVGGAIAGAIGQFATASAVGGSLSVGQAMLAGSTASVFGNTANTVIATGRLPTAEEQFRSASHGATAGGVAQLMTPAQIPFSRATPSRPGVSPAEDPPDLNYTPGSTSTGSGAPPLASVLEGHGIDQGFSGVFDSASGQVLIRPSTDAAVLPSGWVARRGGHVAVSAELGGDRSSHFGFAAILEAGGLRITWLSRSLNAGPSFLVPDAMRARIVDAVQRATGMQVTSQ